MTKEERNIYMKDYYKRRLAIDSGYAAKVKEWNKKADLKHRTTEQRRQYSRTYYKENRTEYYKTDKVKEAAKEYRERNKEHLAAESVKYYQENKQQFKVYNANRKEKRNEVRRNNYNNPIIKLKNNIRCLITTGIKKAGYSKCSKLNNILGCSFEDLKRYFENQFIEGMTWNNIHCDHIIPISIAKTEKDVLLLNNYKNFRPCYSTDNLKKSAKIDLKLIEKYGLIELYNTITTI